MNDNVYLNGRIIPAGEAAVGVWDAGFLHGASTFTTMRAHHGKVFRLDAHLERLMSTAELLGLRTDAAPDALARGVSELLGANGLGESRVRITLTPGSVRDGEATTLITAEPLPHYPPEWYEKGIMVVVSSFKQPSGTITAGYKTGCYLPRILAQREAAAKGAVEALWYTGDNRLAEACFCNVFLVTGAKVFTPPRDTPVLPGVVRAAVIELCGRLGIPCDDGTPLTVREMLSCEEMFLTGSCSGLRPVVAVERHVVGDGQGGPVTRRLMQAYAEMLDAECPPAPAGHD